MSFVLPCRTNGSWFERSYESLTVQGLSTVVVVVEEDDYEEEERKKESTRLQVAVNDAWLCKRSLDN